MNEPPFTNPPGDRNYISTCLGMITYVTSGGGAASLPSAGDGRTNLAAMDFSFADTVDATSIVSAPPGTGPDTSTIGKGNLEQANGLSAVADRQVLVPQADSFGENEQERPVWHPSLQDGFQSKVNPGSREAEAFFTMEFASGQPDGLVTTPYGFGTI